MRLNYLISWLLLSLILAPSSASSQSNRLNTLPTETETILEHRNNNKTNSSRGVDNSIWLHYDDIENYDAWGFLIDGEIYDVVSKWDPSDLTTYNGWEITKIKFIVVTSDPIFKVKVFEGPNATEIYSQDVNTINVNTWTEVVLDTPVPIDITKELWAGYWVDYSASELGGFVTATDDGPPVDEYGNLYRLDGTWYHDYNNHNLRVFIEYTFIANFEADNSTVCTGGTVNFTSLNPNATSWEWTFEGGTPSTSTDENPSVVYNTLGNYDVSLIISDGTNFDTVTVADMITVQETPAQPQAPTGSIDVCGGEEHTYTTNSVPMAASYVWEVTPADAGIISGSDTAAVFESATDWFGAYTIKVKASNSCGNSAWSPELSCNLYFTPAPYNVSQGGGYCEGSNGIEVTLDGSEVDVDYELFLDDVSTGTIVAGTGSALSFGFQTDEGIYSVTGYSAMCTTEMYGGSYIYMMNLPATANQPTGPDMVCAGTISDYQTDAVTEADTLVWVLDPVDAGSIIGDGETISIQWSSTFDGMAYLSVFGSNDCGDGNPSDDLEITVIGQASPEVLGDTVVCVISQYGYSTEAGSGNTYVWEVQGGEIISGTATNEITVEWHTTGTGFVSVLETSSPECEGITDTLYVFVDDCPGVSEKSDAELSVYPNPANDFISIDLKSEQQTCELRIYNQNGQLLIKYSGLIGGGESTKINIETLTPGTYFINVITPSGEVLKQKLEVAK